MTTPQIKWPLHGAGRTLLILMLSAPILVAVPMTPAPPAAKAAAPAPVHTPPAEHSPASFTLADLQAQMPRNPDGYYIISVPDLHDSAADREARNVLSGKPVETTGQLLPRQPGEPRLRLQAARIKCCEAHSLLYSIPVEFSGQPPAIKDLAWLKVTGHMAYRQEAGQTVAMIEHVCIIEIAAPDNAILH